jgi:tricorn protease-like protein
MTVQQLIDRLQDLEPERNVYLADFETPDLFKVTDIEDHPPRNENEVGYIVLK